MIKELGWDSLETRRQKARLTLMFKIANDLVGINKEEHFNPITNLRTRKKKNKRNFSQSMPDSILTNSASSQEQFMNGTL